MRLRHALRDAVRWAKSALPAAHLRRSEIRPGAPHTLPGRLVLSLTSHPPRFPVLDLALRSLMLQDMRPDAIVLWLAGSDMEQLPEGVLALRTHGLVIRRCPDMKSANKLVPAIVAYPDAFVLTADDDIHYPQGWLRRFAEEYRAPNEVLCQRARRITFADGGGLAPYTEWPMIEGEEAGTHVFPTGTGGVLYPPATLSREVTDANSFLRLCPRADDVWFYWMAKRAGSEHRAIRPAGPFSGWSSPPGTRLWDQNKQGGNDRQIRALIETYGLPQPAVRTPKPFAQ